MAWYTHFFDHTGKVFGSFKRPSYQSRCNPTVRGERTGLLLCRITSLNFKVVYFHYGSSNLFLDPNRFYNEALLFTQAPKPYFILLKNNFTINCCFSFLHKKKKKDRTWKKSAVEHKSYFFIKQEDYKSFDFIASIKSFYSNENFIDGHKKCALLYQEISLKQLVLGQTWIVL